MCPGTCDQPVGRPKHVKFFFFTRIGAQAAGQKRKKIHADLEDQLVHGMVPCQILSYSSQLREWQETDSVLTRGGVASPKASTSRTKYQAGYH